MSYKFITKNKIQVKFNIKLTPDILPIKFQKSYSLYSLELLNETYTSSQKPLYFNIINT